MVKPFVLAIDQGTTGTTVLCVSHELEVLGRATVDFAQHYPQPGWVEHHPEEVYQSVLAGISKVFEQSGCDRRGIQAIGITNQRETCLFWDRATTRAFYPAIVWQDRRTADRCQKLREQGHEDRVRRETGLTLDPYFSATKLAWTLDHVDGLREKAKRGDALAGTIDSYLLWRLTGNQVHATDPSNACRTLLWRLDAQADKDTWDDSLLELFDLPKQAFGQVRANNQEFGTTQNVPGIPDGVPIHGIAGDQQAALFGQACFSPRMAKCTYGTGAFALVQLGETPQISQHRLLTSVAWQLAGHAPCYAMEGSSFMAGALVGWLRDGLGMLSSADEVETLASQVEDSEGVIVIPGHAGLGAPHWQPQARGLICGLSRKTDRRHIARATLEGIAMQVADLLDAMSAEIGGTIQEVRVDGGAANNDLLMQLQSDVLQTKMIRPQCVETTALGAAMLAGLGSGFWASQDELAQKWQAEKQFIPTQSAESWQWRRARWQRAIAFAAELG